MPRKRNANPTGEFDSASPTFLGHSGVETRRCSTREKRARMADDDGAPFKQAVSPTTFSVIYCRVSDKESVDSNLSMPDQEQRGRARADAEGWTVVRVYYEPGKTAKTSARPEFKRMMAAALSPERPFSKIIVHSQSRFARNVRDYMDFTSRLYDNDVEVVSLTQDFPKDTGGFIAVTSTATFDEFHSQRTSTDVTRTMTSLAQQGYSVGGAQPLGYTTRPVPDQPRRRLYVIDEDERPLARRIWEMALYGQDDGRPMGVKAIVKWLNSHGYRTRAGSPFSSNSIHIMLTNPMYMGMKLYNLNAHKRRWGTTPPLIRIPVPAIVSPEEFEEVQRLLASKDPLKGVAKIFSSPMLLAGIAQCECGAGLTLATGTSKTGKVYRYYYCNRSNRQGTTGCPGVRISEELLDNAVVDAVIADVLTPHRLRSLLDILQERWSAERQEQKLRISQAQEDLRKSEREFHNLALAAGHSADLAEEPLLVSQMSRVHEALVRHRNVLKGLLASQDDNVEISDAKVELFSEVVIGQLRGADRSRMKSYLRAIISRIEVGNRTIRISGRIADLQKAAAAECDLALEGTGENRVRRYVRRWCPQRDSNSRPTDYKSAALPTEL